jgi:hypothetical protein
MFKYLGDIGLGTKFFDLLDGKLTSEHEMDDHGSDSDIESLPCKELPK